MEYGTVLTTAMANNLTAGTYTVIVRQEQLYQELYPVTLTQPPIITCAPLTTTPVCNGGYGHRYS
ncbi:MAG: hypothetical protein IPP29_20725 [Bacteroidetes bacterium]|nr:hypothetical protein [Bacteroidota bacterium]